MLDRRQVDLGVDLHQEAAGHHFVSALAGPARGKVMLSVFADRVQLPKHLAWLAPAGELGILDGKNPGTGLLGRRYL